MMIDDDDESDGPTGTPKITSSTSAAYASSSVDPCIVRGLVVGVLDDFSSHRDSTAPRPVCSDSISTT